MGAFSRSWKITKLSFDVIKKDKELLLFPLLAGIFSILFIVLMVVPSFLYSLISVDSNSITGYVILFVVYLGLAFIATFFNVCVVYTAKKRFEGGNATFGESIKFSISKLHLIFLWSLLSATVGLLLKILDNLAERMGKSGAIFVMILRSILGMAWSILTIFVVPSMVYYDLTPILAIKKSTETLKKTWGESLIRHFGLGLAQMVFILIGVPISILLFILLPGVIGMIVALSVSVVYFLTVILIFSVANSVFNTALFVYADKGKIPAGYDKETLKSTFKQKSNSLQKGII